MKIRIDRTNVGPSLAAVRATRAAVGAGPYLEFPNDPPGWTPERRDFFLAAPYASTPKAS